MESGENNTGNFKRSIMVVLAVNVMAMCPMRFMGDLHSSSCSYFRSSSTGARDSSNCLSALNLLIRNCVLQSLLLTLDRLGAIEIPSGNLCVTQKPSTIPSNLSSCRNT